MQLTPAQMATLKADILADGPMSGQPMTADGDFEIARLYNLDASPDFTVWKTSVPVNEIMNNGFVWTDVDALSAGKARIWQWMADLGAINPSKPNIRQGLADAFGAATPMGLGILPHLKRLATRVEELYATGTGSDAVPATMGAGLVGIVEGPISAQIVSGARSLP